MDIYLLHLAIDKIGVAYAWDAEVCPCGIPALQAPAWSIYAQVLEQWLIGWYLSKLEQ